ncbi:serine/threonine protein kinase [Saccharopolyspora antimicrobica]|uniref:non-specific serine/threonine protein kinase n=1 Tax=Saccharopolyspora antimicrobica TaxID=455193 RepID=A0A1I4X894_9PSEU|nr:Stk1 family PASTA domain-containing Ser/Thr kinase [Saccharopolyspora antimicrobica]RKT84366.1 serine/threonine-protein kinase [Saccharopolyspora antimicrobica]SFN21915.1 serine/threonine protein kinase [Saccharopolyspora antimicrobica]
MSSPRLLSNRYELGETLGYGGMSEVFRGRDTRLSRDVAVKILRADLARDPTFQLRFRREAQNAAALNHPAIVAVYDTGETDTESGPLPYIVMEYVDGRTLRDIVKTEGPLAPRRAMEVMADASAALDFSHRHGIVHRDVKPANIMITNSGAVKVMDFGIARALADGQAAVTQTAAVIGTAQYLSPEQARGEAVDARSDVYASGCVLFELLTGEPPFTGDSPVAVAYQHVREEPRKPSDVNATVPASLDAVALKALSKNPANRYQSAAEMRADLVRVLSGQRPKAPMIMSDEERTAMLSQSAATELMPPGRHRSVDRDAEEPVDDEKERKRRRTRTVALVTVACVAVFALAAWAVTLLIGSGAEKTEPVPNFVGMMKNAAQERAMTENWNVKLTACPSSREEIDKVVKQKPEYPAHLNRETASIDLCIGTGPESVQVPDLEGLSMTEAQQELEKVGLKLGITPKYEETSDPQLFQRIMNWDSRGSSVAKGTTINVVIGQKIETVTLRDLRGMSYDMAKAYLDGAGFTVRKQTRDSDQPADTVIDQSPAGGTSVRPKSEVVLVVSNGQQITVPQLTGMSPSEAKQALQALGWNGNINEVTQETADKDMDGKVVGSSPGSGQKVGKTQTVTIYVGDYTSSPTTSPGNDGGFLPPFG